ncbi:DUF3316 domain-containing protein [Leucothrix arctica]|uniref:Uncharacterized protein n=1 Tax=Leucothrix arctica TaxID=1481894 RepID=A0A317CAA6_9GAMM|nr:DUF3316 domain-containing protein [Leucothrix arctica]PWQ95544.1 hypothetical protein DKT75_12230 [Leucothrix arctica]
MKTLPKLIATSLLVMGATAANADYYEAITSEKIQTGVTESRSEAYKAGWDKLSSLESASPYTLSSELGLVHPEINESTINIDDGAYITVESQVRANGELGYIGVVNAGVSYEVNKLGN